MTMDGRHVTFRDLFRVAPELRAEVLQGWADHCGDNFCDSRAELRESVDALREGIYLDQCDDNEARAAAWSIGRDLRLARERERETPPDIGQALARYGFLLVGTGGGCTAWEFQGDGWRTLVTLPDDPMAPVTLWEPVTETTEDKDGTACCREYPSLSAYLESPGAALLAHMHAQQGGQ